ncbi:hypothetical protein [Mycoplasma parvum]|uniref:Uncharacterized protein n=1 Tax=Mycoplasma parvum str. Indiana TaxID=1403316 RepID=U5NFF1_9MOLU|nr:hypothetical protein [Mycoplasma parvum]AGX88948.1 hypothetical protein PRV_00915 [Mycoplasma parvum str. Indiana]
MRLWNLLFIPAVGAGSIAGSIGGKNSQIKINGEKIEVNPMEFNYFGNSILEMVETKDNFPKIIKVILPCWNGNLLTEYEMKESIIRSDKYQQHLRNFKEAWKTIVSKIKDILNKTYGCLDASDLKMRIGVINFEKMTKSEPYGMIIGEIKEIKVGEEEIKNPKNNIKFTFNWRNKSGKTIHSDSKIIELYDANIGQETVNQISKLVYKILRESAKLTLKKYTWKKEIKNQGNDVFSAQYFGDKEDRRKIHQFETGGVSNPFELSQWCLSNLEDCTQKNWNDDKLLEFLSSCQRNKETGGKYMLEEFIEQVKEIIKGNNKNNGEECGVWEKGIFCSKGGLIYKE